MAESSVGVQTARGPRGYTVPVRDTDLVWANQRERSIVPEMMNTHEVADYHPSSFVFFCL